MSEIRMTEGKELSRWTSEGPAVSVREDLDARDGMPPIEIRIAGIRIKIQRREMILLEQTLSDFVRLS